MIEMVTATKHFLVAVSSLGGRLSLGGVCDADGTRRRKAYPPASKVLVAIGLLEPPRLIPQRQLDPVPQTQFVIDQA